jgi:hypothetical protein
LVSAEGPDGVCRPHGPPQKTPRLRRRPRGFENLLTGSVGRLCRGALSSGAFCQYLSGLAAVATAGEEIAAAPADGRPHRDSMRIGKIAQFRIEYAALSKTPRALADGLMLVFKHPVESGENTVFETGRRGMGVLKKNAHRRGAETEEDAFFIPSRPAGARCPGP